jgi:N-carbamoylputrescine amidase
MKLIAIQSRLDPGAWADNVERAIAQVRAAFANGKPDLVMLPEGFPDYVRPSGVKGESMQGGTVLKMQQLAGEGDCMILFGMIRKEEDGLHNSAILVDRDSVLCVYDKMHLFSAREVPQLDEQSLFVRGESLGLFDTPSGRIGVIICHDGTYPEIFRALVLKGADVICWLMNNGNVVSWAKHHAMWNIVPIAIANCVGPAVPVGEEVCHSMVGSSVIVDGNGAILAEAGSQEPEILSAELDLSRWREIRSNGDKMQAVYTVRRPDLYGAITEPNR